MSEKNDNKKNQEIEKIRNDLRAEIDGISKLEIPGGAKVVMGVVTTLGKMREVRDAGKTPEQLAIEAQQRKTQDELQGNQKHAALYKKWCQRDTWLLKREAIPLAFGDAPSDLSDWFLNAREQELYALARSCAGHSLKVVSPGDKPELWRVTPVEWLRWLKEKGRAFPLELAAALQSRLLAPGPGPAVPEPPTKRATLARGRQKQMRMERLDIFINDLEQRARKANFGWDRSGIPVTKTEFLEVFYRINPNMRKFKLSSFEADFRTLGIKFKSGIKRNKNNVFKELFNTV